ncbi:F-box/kelch-repeat protein At3g06240-like [Lotus japonicus]|uniref:F-box/kelch-repeat protein At3g06240-like n=1 Tax=Lotus japonicus TaxID=34305 RepID=UPI00258A33BA|nr:F-box/kelch-repeat protein At3g06240-like [Lotus japonicus]
MENEKKKNLTLPHDLIIEILLRLPVRSLLRFKCVCKSWFFLISDTEFAKSHFDLDVALTHRLLLQFPNKYRVESFDLDSSLDDSSAVVTLNFPPPSKSLYLNPLYFLGSCRGFMLLAYDFTSNVIVWNPSTGFRQQILDDSYFMSNSLYGFGYDKITDDYFLVLIALSFDAVPFGEILEKRIRTFSLKTRSWYNAKDVNVDYMDCGRVSRPGVILNDSLHWLVSSFITGLHLVIAFDLVEKSLSEIPLSPNLEGVDMERVSFEGIGRLPQLVLLR